jgi:hypothetical protein
MIQRGSEDSTFRYQKVNHFQCLFVVLYQCCIEDTILLMLFICHNCQAILRHLCKTLFMQTLKYRCAGCISFVLHSFNVSLLDCLKDPLRQARWQSRISRFHLLIEESLQLFNLFLR